MVAAATKMHNSSPADLAAYLNARLREAGFSVMVHIGE
jgi:hypothetical protein